MKQADSKKTFLTVDEYLLPFPAAVQVTLEKLRNVIKTAAPKAEELISYQMPAYKYRGMLVYFAAYKNHIGFYPTTSGIETFKKELSVYKGAKGSVQFPINEPLPFSLITKIVKFRVQENEATFVAKQAKKAGKQKAPVKKKTDAEQVKDWMNKLDKQVKDDIETVRNIIKKNNPKLQERIKWNAPSYFYKEDIVTFGPYKNNCLLLVFHHPAVVKIKSNLLTGNYKDRRLVTFSNKKEAIEQAQELTRIIQEIMKQTDQKKK